MPFAIELILTIIGLEIVIQLMTAYIEYNGNLREIIQTEKSYMKFRLKPLFWAVNYMYKRRHLVKCAEGTAVFPNWDANRISKHVFWFGITSMIMYMLAIVCTIIHYALYSTTIFRLSDSELAAPLPILFILLLAIPFAYTFFAVLIKYVIWLFSD